MGYDQVLIATAALLGLVVIAASALRAELGSLKDRLGNVERIVTDGGYHLTSQIEALREPKRDKKGELQ